MFEQLIRKLFFALVAVATMAGATSASAADYNGTVQGVVKDSSGVPVAGAFVKLKNAERRLTFMVISQEQGRYTAKNLPPGSYAVQGVGGGYQSQTSTRVDVKADQSASVDLALTVQRAPQLAFAWPGRAPGFGGGESGRAAAPLSPPEGPGKQLVMG